MKPLTISFALLAVAATGCVTEATNADIGSWTVATEAHVACKAPARIYTFALVTDDDDDTLLVAASRLFAGDTTAMPARAELTADGVQISFFDSGAFAMAALVDDGVTATAEITWQNKDCSTVLTSTVTDRDRMQI